ncbi:hypothetical protein D3C73_1640200 [compost metagenome]
MRVATYSWAFIADSAAVRTMKFITPAPKGIPSIFITSTNGLSPTPACCQGTRATIRATVPM